MTPSDSPPWPPASRPGEFTSKAAERDITGSGKRQSHAAMILDLISANPDLTGSELATLMHGGRRWPALLTESQVHKRTSDLLNLGKIEKSGIRVCSVNNTLRATWRVPRRDDEQGVLL